MGLFDEIGRRKVIQGTAAYAVAGWLAIQLAIALEASLDLPTWFDRSVTLVVICGFPIAILLSWLFDISLAGFRLTRAPVAEASADMARNTRTWPTCFTSSPPFTQPTVKPRK